MRAILGPAWRLHATGGWLPDRSLVPATSSHLIEPQQHAAAQRPGGHGLVKVCNVPPANGLLTEDVWRKSACSLAMTCGTAWRQRQRQRPPGHSAACGQHAGGSRSTCRSQQSGHSRAAQCVQRSLGPLHGNVLNPLLGCVLSHGLLLGKRGSAPCGMESSKVAAVNRIPLALGATAGCLRHVLPARAAMHTRPTSPGAHAQLYHQLTLLKGSAGFREVSLNCLHGRHKDRSGWLHHTQDVHMLWAGEAQQSSMPGSARQRPSTASTAPAQAALGGVGKACGAGYD